MDMNNVMYEQYFSYILFSHGMYMEPFFITKNETGNILVSLVDDFSKFALFNFGNCHNFYSGLKEFGCFR